MKNKKALIYLGLLFFIFNACTSINEEFVDKSNLKEIEPPHILTDTLFPANSKAPIEIRLKKDSSYYISSDTTFTFNTHLIIEAGATLYIADSCNIIVEGRLSFLGSKEHPIYLIPQKQFWGKLFLKSDRKSKSIIKNTYFKNGRFTAENAYLEITNSHFTQQKSSSNKQAILLFKQSNLTIEQCIIENNSKISVNGLTQYGGTANIFNNTFLGLKNAINLIYCSNSDIAANRIKNTMNNAMEFNICHHLQIYDNKIRRVKKNGILIGNIYEGKERNGISQTFFLKNNSIKYANTGISIKNTDNLRLYQNRIEKTVLGLSIKGLETTKNTKIFNNVFYSNKTATEIQNISEIEQIENIEISKTTDKIIHNGFKYLSSKNISSTKHIVLENPILKIQTHSNAIPLENKIKASLEQQFEDSTLFISKIKIELRGSSSLRLRKRSYSFKIDAENNEQKIISILNLPPSHKWVLYGPFLDKSGIRNALSYQLGKAINMNSPNFRFINLFINERYEGVYMLLPRIGQNSFMSTTEIFEHIKDSTSSPCIIFKMDKLNTERKGKEIYGSKYQSFINYYVQYPNLKHLNTNDKNWLKNYIEQFESSIVDSQNLNSINLESFVNYAIIMELTKNLDAYRNSQYFYKYKNNNTLYAGPLWDFDLSMGSYSYDKNSIPEGFAHNFTEDYKKYFPEIWLKLFENKTFKKAVIKHWKYLRQSILSNQFIDSEIQNLHSQIQNDITFENNNKYQKYSEQDELEHLLNWMHRRIKWLDENIQEY